MKTTSIQMKKII